MHITIEHIDTLDKFQEIVGILNKYRADGNDGRGRFYQFMRMGNNAASTVDFEKAYRLYKIYCHREDYQLEQLLANRYGEAYVRRMNKRKNDVVERFEEAKHAMEMHLKNQGRAG